MRFEETGEMPVREWSTLWEITECDGRPVAPDRLPLMIAFGERRPVHSELWIRGLEGTRRRIGATAFPLIRMDQLLGAVAIFWETAPWGGVSGGHAPPLPRRGRTRHGTVATRPASRCAVQEARSSYSTRERAFVDWAASLGPGGSAWTYCSDR